MTTTEDLKAIVGFRDDWQMVYPGDNIHLGTFVWKYGLVFCHDEPGSERLHEFLDGDIKDFKYSTDTKYSTVPAKMSTTAKKGLLEILSFRLFKSSKEQLNASQLHVKTTWIKRRDLEKDLKQRKLDMESPYIKDKKIKECIPCIVNGIMEVTSNEQTGATFTSNNTGRNEATVQSGSTAPVGALVSETSEESTTLNINAKLYRVLPLRVDLNGCVEAVDNSGGFEQEEGKMSRKKKIFQLVKKMLCLDI